MGNKKAWIAVFALFGLVLLNTPRAYSQAVSGSITGYVYDPNDAAIPGATVTVINVDTGIETARTTDGVGRYLVTNLVPGTYTIAVEATGFQLFLQENVVLRVDSTVRVDPKLQLGQVTEQVTISAAPPMLKSEKTDVGTFIPEQQLSSLPTFGRNLSKLYNTVPGVIQNLFQIGIGKTPRSLTARW